MSVEALVEQVPVDVGRRVREARTARGWTLDQLAERSGVSRRMVVNVEAAHSNASIATLLRLATALQVSLADLVADSPARAGASVTHASTREPLWTGPHGGSAVLVAAADTPDMLELWEWSLEPGERFESDPHRPGTFELLHVHAGRLTLVLDGEATELRVGDAATLAADVAHAYANDGARVARFTMAVSEPVGRVRP